MTTILELNLDYLGQPLHVIKMGELKPDESREADLDAAQQVERVANMVEHYQTVAFIHHSYAEDIAAIIPVALAKELIREGRIEWPLYTSRTVRK